MTAPPPINVKIPGPTVCLPDWPTEERLWVDLNVNAGGNPGFHPLTIKFFYVHGVIHTLAQSVQALLDSLDADISLLPAYGVFASGVELLGRCLNGNDGRSNNSADLRVGFNWLADYSLADDAGKTVSRTSTHNYTADELTQLRHFAAHGQATTSTPIDLDYEILGPMPGLLANGIQEWWTKLNDSDDFCNMLAKANVLAFRSVPIFETLRLFSAGGGDSIENIFRRFRWQARR
jgi:hypothetical protein